MTSKNTRDMGTEGEQRAVDFLIANNYTILKTNYRVGRIGEIDIIAKDAEYICFIEVKTRRSYSFGTPGEAVTFPKQEKIKLIASIYLSNTGNMNSCVRFDVVEVLMVSINSTNEIKNINLIKNAF
ncbi:MAG TPA: YraN family protein [Ruminiclostridium sp.]